MNSGQSTPHAASAPLSSDVHTQGDLERSLQCLRQPGAFDGEPGRESVVMSGRWNWRFQDEGLVMHSSQCTEHETMKVSVELPPGISFNILFAGEVGFTLCGERHVLGRHFRPVECAGFALDRPGILTRHLKKEQHVSKINIFAEKRWLESRFGQGVERSNVERLFDNDGAVCYWSPSERLVSLARRLATSDAGDSLVGAMQLQGQILELLAACIGEFEPTAKPVAKPARSTAPRVSGRLSRKIRESLLDPDISLKRIADTCNMSVSTLQRRFRAAYGMTVSDYMRMARLERARAAIICGELSVGEAAYLAGYRHTSNFITAFKKQFSLTPAAYRQSHRRIPAHDSDD